jgi:hypothetical protein
MVNDPDFGKPHPRPESDLRICPLAVSASVFTSILVFIVFVPSFGLMFGIVISLLAGGSVLLVDVLSPAHARD